jgi:hypothetical protein
MSAELGRFEAFYGSFVQHPVLLWAVAVLAVALCLARRDLHPSVRRYCVGLGALSAFDAWLTSSPVPGLGELPEALGSAVPLLFVLAGDFRYLLVVTAGTPDGTLAPGARSLAAAAGLTLVVPLLSQLVVMALPEASARVLYLVYEVLFLALAAVLASRHPGARAAPWIRALSRFVMLYYGLWAAADAVLLATGSDLGHALRVVPNLLYYGGLIIAIGWLAPGRDT